MSRRRAGTEAPQHRPGGKAGIACVLIERGFKSKWYASGQSGTCPS